MNFVDHVVRIVRTCSPTSWRGAGLSAPAPGPADRRARMRVRREALRADTAVATQANLYNPLKPRHL